MYISLPLFCTTTTWSFQKLLSSRSLFSTAAHFHLTLLLAASISHFVTATTKFFSKNLCRSFSRWPSLACRPLSLLLCLSPALYSKFVDMTIYLSLILSTTRIQKKFPLSVFVFIDSFVVSALQDAGGYAISRQNNLELHLGCHTCWLSYFTLVCLWCGRTVSRAGGRSVYGHVITNFSQFSRMGRSLHFLTYGAPLARFGRESSAINWSNNCLKELCETLLNRANSSTYSQKTPAVTWFGLFYFTREEPGKVQKEIELWDSFKRPNRSYWLLQGWAANWVKIRYPPPSNVQQWY